MYQDPDSFRMHRIDYKDIEDIAQDLGDSRKVEDIDDDTFWSYADILLEKRK